MQKKSINSVNNSAVRSKRILIIGAGPTGLGSAFRLHELGHENWAIYEKEETIGGLARSFQDENGFTWDIGGHVMFSTYEHYNNLMDRFLGKEYISHERESWIRMLNKWIPYPFQNNIRFLPKEIQLECIIGLINTHNFKKRIGNFEEWILKIFGRGIAKYFMLPYNFKVWAFPLKKMNFDWIAQRVSLVDIERVLKNIVHELTDAGWGPNNKFKFPLHGGTGGFFDKLEPFVKDKIVFRKKLIKIDALSKVAIFDDGTRDRYDFIINTSPLNELVRMIPQKKGTGATLNKYAAELKHNGIYVVGIGLNKRNSETKCWIYSPEKGIPFYRMTYFSNYSPFNVPDGNTENYCSLLAEISFSRYKHLDENQIVDLTIDGVVKAGIISEIDGGKIVSKWTKKVEYAYPIPTLGRDRILSKIQKHLEGKSIYSRGRFGAWKYEIGNMDHSLLMGIEIVNRLLKGKKETIWNL